MGLGAGSVDTGKFCNLYPHLFMGTVFQALKPTQIVTCIIIILTFFLENW